MKRNTRVEIANDTLAIIERGNYRNNMGEEVSIKTETEAAIADTKLFRAEDFPDNLELKRSFDPMQIEITDESTLEAAKRICLENENENPFILNFASAKNPGGGFLGGAEAQEESLARSSSLYPCLMANFEFYEFNRKENNIFYSDWMIYSPKVPVFKNDDGSLIRKPYLASFLTSPAVNAGNVKDKQPGKMGLIDEINAVRARKFLWLANKYGHKTLILGAWGCGVFKNDTQMIAEMFKGLLKGEFANCFERIVMAIYDSSPSRRVYKAFDDAFGREQG